MPTVNPVAARLCRYINPYRDDCQYSVFLKGYSQELESVGMGAINAMTAAQFPTHPYPCLRYKKRFSKVARPRLRRLAWLLFVVSITRPGLVTIRRVDIQAFGKPTDSHTDSLPQNTTINISYQILSILPFDKIRHRKPLFCPQNSTYAQNKIRTQKSAWHRFFWTYLDKTLSLWFSTIFFCHFIYLLENQWVSYMRLDSQGWRKLSPLKNR